MNQRFWRSVTTTLITTAFATTISSPSSSNKVLASDFEGNSTLTETATSTPSSTTEAIDLVTDRESQLSTAIANREGQIATTYTYQLGESSATTIYIRSIPFLTFLSSTTTSANNKNTEEIIESKSTTEVNISQSQNDPASRATQLAVRLNQLNQGNIDANKITVSWNGESESYSIKVGEEELVKVNEINILADTTENVAEDALQATNRLRRWLGGAPPLDEITGKPKPQEKALSLRQERVLRQIRGIASWYGPGFHGRRSASGERFNQNALTAAHRYLPFGTRVRVTNLNNGRSVVVRINDRGPYSGRRIIDLSAGAARAIGMIRSGTAQVRVEVLGR